MRRIVYTRPDGGVNICHPSPDYFQWLSCGGYWAGKSSAWREEQVERHIRAGHREWAVRRYIKAMDQGGCTTAEAYEIIRDRDCGHLGSGFELWDYSDLPDRWFRDAWVRSHNGGPISINLNAAREIQVDRIGKVVDQENQRRSSWANKSRYRQIEVSFDSVNAMLKRADSAEAIRSVWPDELHGKANRHATAGL